MHFRTIGIKDPDDLDPDPVLLMIICKKGFSTTFSFIITGTYAQWDLHFPSKIQAEDEWWDHHTPHWWRPASILALILLASPSILMAPITEVFTVFMGLYW